MCSNIPSTYRYLKVHYIHHSPLCSVIILASVDSTLMMADYKYDGIWSCKISVTRGFTSYSNVLSTRQIDGLNRRITGCKSLSRQCCKRKIVVLKLYTARSISSLCWSEPDLQRCLLYTFSYERWATEHQLSTFRPMCTAQSNFLNPRGYACTSK